MKCKREKVGEQKARAHGAFKFYCLRLKFKELLNAGECICHTVTIKWEKLKPP